MLVRCSQLLLLCGLKLALRDSFLLGSGSSVGVWGSSTTPLLCSVSVPAGLSAMFGSMVMASSERTTLIHVGCAKVGRWRLRPRPLISIFKAIAGSVCYPSEGEVSNALDGDAGQDAQDSEEDKGAEVEEDDDAEDEGWIEERHLVCHGPGAIRDLCCREEVTQRPRSLAACSLEYRNAQKLWAGSTEWARDGRQRITVLDDTAGATWPKQFWGRENGIGSWNAAPGR